MRKSQAGLDKAMRTLVDSGRSQECLDAFDVMSRAMNKAMEAHRRAVEAFNDKLACSAAAGNRT
jgi:hypothetical protein